MPEHIPCGIYLRIGAGRLVRFAKFMAVQVHEDFNGSVQFHRFVRNILLHSGNYGHQSEIHRVR